MVIGLMVISSVQLSRSVMSNSLRPHGTVSRQVFPVHHHFPSLLKFMSVELVMPSNLLILCRSFLLLPPIFPSSRIFSNELTLCIRWPKYWSFIFTFLHMYTFFIHTWTFSDGLSPQKSPWKAMIQVYCYYWKCFCIPHWGMFFRTNFSLLKAHDTIC